MRILLVLALAFLIFLPQTVYASESFKQVSASWYAKGLKDPEAFTTACWSDYPKGTLFKVSYKNNSVVVRCNDRGHFKEMGRFLDLSSGAFKQLAPLSRGVIKVDVEVVTKK